MTGDITTDSTDNKKNNKNTMNNFMAVHFTTELQWTKSSKDIHYQTSIKNRQPA